MFESGVAIQRSPVLNFAAMQAQSVLQTAAVVLIKNISEEKRAVPPGGRNVANIMTSKIPTHISFPSGANVFHASGLF